MVQNLLPTQTHFFKWRWLNEWLYRLREILTDNWTDSTATFQAGFHQQIKVWRLDQVSSLSLWSEGRKLTSKVPGKSVGWGGSSCRYRIRLRGPGNCKYRSRCLRMHRRAAWSGDKVREGKTSRRSLPWPMVLSFTGLPRYLAIIS